MSGELDLSLMRNCVCFNLRRATRALTQFFDVELRRHGIRPTQSPILTALAAKSDWSMETLSKWLGMERTTLLRNLRPLQRDGLVRAKGGGRAATWNSSFTEKGRKALAEMQPAWRSAQDRAVAILGKERWSTIIGELDRVAAQLKQGE